MRPIITAIAAMALMTVSCGAGDVAGTSTTEGTVPRTSTTTGDVETTTTSLLTTSTPDSTTTSSSSSTTAGPLEGDWADKPLITSNSFYPALGWWDGGEWVEVSENTDLPFQPGDDFQVARLGSQTRLLSGQPTEACAIGPTGVPGVELSDQSALTLEVDGVAYDSVAISAPWELVPHDVEATSDDGTYAGFAADLLSARGFPSPNPEMKQLISLDLEGDGVDEALIVVEDTEIAPDASGVYSLVVLRRIGTSGEVETHVLEESVIPAGETGFPESYAVTAIADLNGDRTMEIVVAGLAWENSWVTVFEATSEMDAPVARLGAGCGV